MASAILACATRQKGERAEEYLINGEAIKYSEWLAVIEQHLGVANRHRLPAKLLQLCCGPLRQFFSAVRLRVPIIMPAYKRAIFERKTLILSDKATTHFGWRPCLLFKSVIANDEGEVSA